jgi:hypothetical protein
MQVIAQPSALYKGLCNTGIEIYETLLSLLAGASPKVQCRRRGEGASSKEYVAKRPPHPFFFI